jgi:hypothetical protein
MHPAHVTVNSPHWRPDPGLSKLLTVFCTGDPSSVAAIMGADRIAGTGRQTGSPNGSGPAGGSHSLPLLARGRHAGLESGIDLTD